MQLGNLFKFKKIGFLKTICLITIFLFFLFNIFLYFSLPTKLKPFFGDGYWALFGHNKYLVLLQNNTELRPTGGFISSLAEINVFFGIPYKFNFANSYLIDNSEENYFEPPLEQKMLLTNKGYRGLTFRDANYNPDFPESYANLLHFYNFYHQTPNHKFDGVIAVNFSFLEELLGIIGPIKVSEELFEKNNLFRKLEFLTKNIDLHNKEELLNRKNIVKELFNTMVKKMVKAPFSWDKYAQFLEVGLDKKEVIVYFEDQQKQQKVESNNWAARLLPTISGQPETTENKFLGFDPLTGNYQDFLSYNQSNYGGRKSDRYLSKEFNYQVKIESDWVVYHDFKVAIDHLGESNSYSFTYTGYSEFYFPQNIELRRLYGDIKLAGLEESSETEIAEFITGFNQGKIDLNYQQTPLLKMANYLNFHPKSKFEFGYDYFRKITTSDWVIEDEDVSKLPQKYSLLVRKQPGSKNDYYKIAIDLPENTQAKLIESNHEKLQILENVVLWQGVLEQDLFFEIAIELETTPPVIIKQDMSADLSQVRLIFGEKINPDSIVEALFMLTDTDEIFPEITDNNLQIISQKLQFDSEVLLTVSGITEQKEEYYRLEIEGIRDLNGNLISPNPKKVTVVQANFEF